MTPPDDPPTEAPGTCVLIAEDNAEVNHLLAEALREAGCEVVQAFDGLEAHELAHKHRPAVILLDLDLPRLYGQVVMRSLRREPATARINVVVLTGQPWLLRDDDRAAAFAVLHKPVGPDTIVRAVRAALRAP
jgi:CheY-like chemotaxis protein